MKKHCLACGKEFTTWPSYIKRGENRGLYCSRKCAQSRHEKTTPRENRKCPECGKMFQRRAKVKQTYCSIDCFYKAVRSGRHRTSAESKRCERCGKEFKPKGIGPKLLGRYPNSGRFCSRECYFESRYSQEGVDHVERLPDLQEAGRELDREAN